MGKIKMANADGLFGALQLLAPVGRLSGRHGWFYSYTLVSQFHLASLMTFTFLRAS